MTAAPSTRRGGPSLKTKVAVAAGKPLQIIDGVDLFGAGLLCLGSDGQAPSKVARGKRIGISHAVDCSLRFYVRGNRFVSGPQALNR